MLKKGKLTHLPPEVEAIMPKEIKIKLEENKGIDKDFATQIVEFLENS